MPLLGIHKKKLVKNFYDLFMLIETKGSNLYEFDSFNTFLVRNDEEFNLNQ